MMCKGGDGMINEQLGEHSRSYEAMRDHMLRYDPDEPMRQVMLLHTTDTANRRVVEREAASFIEGAVVLGMSCSSVPDPLMKAPEYAIVICVTGTASQMTELASYMIHHG